MRSEQNFTQGPIFQPLVRFALPVLLALFLQAMYGAVDLLVVGHFGRTADVSGVATGSMLVHTLTMGITGLAMGITILVGQKIGEGKPEEAGRTIGGGICLFAVVSVALTLLEVIWAEPLAALLRTPEEAFAETVAYIRICGGGTVFIMAYNLLGSIFRGMGDSKMPLITVAIACGINILGDLVLVAGLDMGAAGAAWATVLAQAFSVLISFLFIRRRQLPFRFGLGDIRFHKDAIGRILQLGLPVALQELLVGASFTILQAIVNTMGVIASAGVGVAEKVCAFIMLVASAYMQSMCAFVAQNIGAAKPERARKALLYGIGTSVLVGIVTGSITFFYGDVLASVFDGDPQVIAAAHSYLKAYAVDCVLTAFLFCFIGYYNGYGKTLFVMAQGIIGAFGVRIPVAYCMSRLEGATLFMIGLGTPASTVVQIILCVIMLLHMERGRQLQYRQL